MEEPVGEITRLLEAARDGDSGALDRVMSIVYDDLRRIAGRRLREKSRLGKPPSLAPTELVNESFLRLVKQRNRYDSRGHFFAIANKVMMRVLLDHHRAKQRDKREGGMVRVSLSDVVRRQGHEPSTSLPAFVRAMEKLETLDHRTAEVATLKVMWGLTVPEIAKTLAVSVSTVEREWRFARRWLMAELGATER